MIKKDKTNKVSLGLRCGDCIHHGKIAKFERPCIQLGVQQFASAPDCFSPDVYQLTKHNAELLNQLGLLVRDFTQNQFRILSFTFKSINIMLRHGLKFGQPVYFCLGKDYLSHYFKGYVIGASTDGQYIYITSHLKKSRSATLLTLYSDSVLTVSTFKSKRKELLEANRLSLPSDTKTDTQKIPLIALINARANINKPKKDVLADYTPPTLDNAPDGWIDIHEKKVKPKTKRTPKVTVETKKSVSSVKIQRKKAA